MDLKGIPWVGDMCQKIESFCVEVEETMYQDTAKYVEDQMRTVGQTFKKIYSDVMQDFLPSSSSNPVEAEAPHVPVVHTTVGETSKKLYSGVSEIRTLEVEDSVNANEAEQMVKSSDDPPNCDNVVNYRPCSSVVHLVNKPCSVEEERDSKQKPPSETVKAEESVNTKETEQMVKSTDDTPNSNNVVNYRSFSFVLHFKPCCVEEEGESEHKPPSETQILNSSVNEDSGEKFTFSEPQNGSDESFCRVADVGSKSTSVVDQESHSEEDEMGISEEVTEANRSFGGSDAVEGSNGETTEPFSQSISGYFDERSNLMIAGKIEDSYADKCGALVIEQVEKVNLGQSCVLVENELPLRLPLQNKHKSYKKNIRNVFSIKRWSKGKQAEEQLAVWYKEDSGKNLVPISSLDEGVHDSHSSDSFDFDWELI